MPKVSVLIPSYNSEQFLAEAIDSALNQTFQDLEIIVIDDGSKDSSGEIAKRYQQLHPQKVRYLYQENAGLAVARNVGLRSAYGEYIAILDSDDIWLPEHIQEAVQTLDADHNIGLVHANYTRVDEEGKILSTPQRDLRFLSGKMFEHIFLRRADIACPTVVFRKKCSDQVGGFDQNLTRLGCEDRELWLRIAQISQIMYINKVHAYYRMRHNSMSKNREKMLLARQYVVDKFCPAKQEGGLRGSALAKIHQDCANELLFSQNFNDAVQEYLISISYRPFTFWTWLNLFKAFFRVKIKNDW